MDHYPQISPKRARARRMLPRKQKYVKRLKTTKNTPKANNVNIGVGSSLFPFSTTTPTYTPNASSLRKPLADITTSINSRKTVEQVVAEGDMLSAMFGGSLPRPSYHGFRNPKTCLNIQDVRTNLMDRFATHDNEEFPENYVQPKRGRGRPKKIQIDTNYTIYPQGHVETGSSSTVNSTPQSQHVLAPRRGRPPKSFGLPTFTVKPTLEDQTSVLLETSNKQNINEITSTMHLAQQSRQSQLPPTSPIFRTTTFTTHLNDGQIVDSDEDFSTDDDNISGSYSMPYPSNEYYDIGDPLFECRYCFALMWYQERMEKHKHSVNPKYSMCCGNGKVEISFLKTPPPVLNKLLFDHDSIISRKFKQQIRVYNIMFAFTSPGAKLDNKYNNGYGPPIVRIQGQSCHRIGSLLPPEGQKPKFAQLYIYDTENEVENIMDGLRDRTNIDPEIVQQLSSMLYEHNTHAKSFQMAKERINIDNIHNLKLRLISDRKTDGRIYNQPTVSEVAALIVGDVDTAEERDIIMEKRSGKLKRIDEFHASYLAFQYLLIFTYGEDGYRPDVAHRDLEIFDENKRNRLTIREWLAFRIQSRSNEAKTLLSSRRLFQQFLVDGYTMMESERLTWLRNNQSKLRVSKYNNLNEQGDESAALGSSTGKRVALPSSYIGSRRFMDQLYYDGMAIYSKVGFPDLFITFTCNPNWPEIKRVLGPLHLKPQDRPDIISRVFKLKFDELLSDLTKKGILGKVLAYMYTIEFQKRGLPHAHILIFLHPSNKYPAPSDIDRIISAEIPDPVLEPRLYDLVKTHMVHGPCGLANQNSQCMKDGKCSKYYPKKFQSTTVVDQDGYPIYRRRDNGNTIDKNGIILHNGHVVPHNPNLLLKYGAQINMEWCNQSTSIKYLFKYINKGSDRISPVIVPSDSTNRRGDKNIDEIKQYLDCRYVSPSEACWRIFSYSIHGRKPVVERLFFHLEGEHSIYYRDYEQIGDVLIKPSVTEFMFTAWFEANNKYEEARLLTYGQFVSKFVYVKKSRTWKPRQRGYTIGRLMWVLQCTGELYYLRMMLTAKKGPISYDDIKNIDGFQHKTFRDACFAMGFLQDDREFIEAIKEAHLWGSGQFLRKLFVTMLLSASMDRPEHVWSKTWHYLSDGVLYDQRRLAKNPGLILTDEEIKQLTLMEIESLLQNNRRTLKDFKTMPYPDDYVIDTLGNRLVYEERQYDVVAQAALHQKLFSSLTGENSAVTCKTFMWNTLSDAIHSKECIVLNVASSRIASLLLPGGRTTHSKFKIHVPTIETSICNIDKKDELAQLLRLTDLIIWDEAPMANKFCFEALDKSLKDIMSQTNNGSNAIFGGKVIVFGVLKLTKNMRLRSGNSASSIEEVEHFSNWILQIGDGKVEEPNDGYTEIEIPPEFLISDFNDPIEAIVSSTYPNLVDNYKDSHFLQSRAILASTIEVVDEINDYVTQLIPGNF
ncbi:uncharacterized protein LOC131598443 [Vicia villosa]|uniref:uncharacterized protein LOC131598443 n=1 Tax=Vicia villosa TaxID=3911 RepID=UPI00273AB4E9|nr:uncharacterized protein LOC131598443 [Vicia villosa]